MYKVKGHCNSLIEMSQRSSTEDPKDLRNDPSGIK